MLAEELRRVSMSLGSCHGIHAGIVAPYLVELTTEEQRGRRLRGSVSGEILTAIGMTAPSGGSDLAALKATAVRDGDHWALNGSKPVITNGYSADLVAVAARTFLLARSCSPNSSRRSRSPAATSTPRSTHLGEV